MSTTQTITIFPPDLQSINQPAPIPSTSALFIKPGHGFLPPSPPLKALPPLFQAWDALAASLPQLLSSPNPTDLRRHVRSLPLLSTANLESAATLHRAFVVLGFLIHGYVWADFDHPEPVIPPSLAVPYLDVCERLGMQPTLSYAGLCLWNWQAKVQGNWELENLQCLVTFTGTRHEEAFYLVPVMVEAEGAVVVRLLENALQLVAEKRNAGAIDEVITALDCSTEVLKKLSGFIGLLHRDCHPQVLYHRIRPYLRGAKGLEANGFPDGCIFQTGNDRQVHVKCVGGSAAQSSLFPFIDWALGVAHKPSGSDEAPTVFEEMRLYMPKEHREFLKVTAEKPSLRSFVESQADNERLVSAYNGCIKQLSSWRSRHIGVVTTHIVIPARKAQAEASSSSPEKSEDGDGSEKVAKTKTSKEDESQLQGTGGSALIPFLKLAKQDTIDSCV